MPQTPAFLSVLALCLPLAMPVQAQDIASAAPAEVALATVTTAKVTKRLIVGRVPVSGTLVARDEVLILPQVNGFPIDSLDVEIGAKVQQGQVLARLNDRSLTAQLAQAQAEQVRANAAISQARNQITSAEAAAEQAATTLTRTKALVQAATATQSALDQAMTNARTSDAALATARDGLLVAEAQLQQAKAQLDIAALNLDHATLRAPVSGLIAARNGQIGAIASPAGEPIYRIIKDGVIEIEVEVIETALGDVATGDRADLSIASVGAVRGTVRRIAPTVDARNRLGKVRIATDAPGLRAGLFASGWIITTERQALTIPTTAVLTDLGGTFVMAVKDGVLQKRAVTAGLIWDGFREVLDGLAEGEAVVAKAGAFFGDGDRIIPTPAQETAP